MVSRCLHFFILLLIFTPQGVVAHSPVKNMSEIHKICSKSPAECLTEVNKVLLTTKEQSRVWYDLIQYKVESLFLLQNIKELNAVTKPWITIDDLPVPFKISVYIYYAKSLTADNDIDKELIKSESKKYIKKAEQQLDLMNNAYPDPMLLIQLANIKMFVGEYEQAYQSLQALTVKYQRRQDPAFKLDLYGNLAHLADRLKYKQQAINYWIESIDWAKKHGNDQQIATVYFNLAQSQISNNDFEAAKPNYLKAIHHSTLANDGAKKAQAQYFFAKQLYTQGLKVDAKAIIETVDLSFLTLAENKRLLKLKSAIDQ